MMARTNIQSLVSHADAADFASQLRKMAEEPGDAWEHSVLPEEIGLERWVRSFTPFGREVLATVAVAAARTAYPSVVVRAGEDAQSFGIAEDASSLDGEALGMQVRRVEAWLASPGDVTREALAAAFDPTRQLLIWDDDLRPSEDEYDASWQWFLEVGQLCVATCLRPMDSESTHSSYYWWAAPDCAARAVVCSLKALRAPGSIAKDIAAIGRAVAQAFADA
jgi:hypothetical protein